MELKHLFQSINLPMASQHFIGQLASRYSVNTSWSIAKIAVSLPAVLVDSLEHLHIGAVDLVSVTGRDGINWNAETEKSTSGLQTNVRDTSHLLVVITNSNRYAKARLTVSLHCISRELDRYDVSQIRWIGSEEGDLYCNLHKTTLLHQGSGHHQ